MEFVQLQINYADWENSAIKSRACYEIARKYNKPVIIMEPVKGGLLAAPPEKVAKVFDNANAKASYASWAIRFAASLEGVITVLSGMSNIEQMEDNLSYMEHFNKLSEEETIIIKKAQEALNSIPLIPCTTCNYCAKVCPMNIGISGSFTAMNYLTLYQKKDVALMQENWMVKGSGKNRADDCIKCGKCEEVCPQHIAIREKLVNVSNALIN
jgi:predicted aldo/keto reductase-like oxidoreductase